MKLLEHIKSKPSDVKAQYSALVAGIVTGAIAVVWVSTLPARFAEMGAPTEGAEDGMAKFGELIGDTREQLGNVVGANEAGETSVTTSNLDILGADGAPGSGAERAIGDLFTPEPEEESSVKDVATSTGEGRASASTAKSTPRIILIGTSTTGASQ